MITDLKIKFLMPLCVEMYICSSGAANCFRVAAVVMDTDQVWLDHVSRALVFLPASLEKIDSSENALVISLSFSLIRGIARWRAAPRRSPMHPSWYEGS